MGSGTKGELAFSCTCGALRGHLTARGAKTGTHVGCYCRDCRAAQLWFGQPDPAPGPVDIFQMSPEDIIVEQGAEHLAAIQLGPKGMLRWYAGCCDMPIATTPQRPNLPFAGFCVKTLSNPERLGPIKTRGFVPRPDGKTAHKDLRFAAWGLITRVVRSRLSGSWKRNPFFKPGTNEPTVRPKILSKEERSALYT